MKQKYKIRLFFFRKKSQIHVFSKDSSWPRQAGEMGWQMLYDIQHRQIQKFRTWEGRTLAMTQARAHVTGEQLCFQDSHRQQAKHEPTACPWQQRRSTASWAAFTGTEPRYHKKWLVPFTWHSLCHLLVRSKGLLKGWETWPVREAERARLVQYGENKS